MKKRRLRHCDAVPVRVKAINVASPPTELEQIDMQESKEISWSSDYSAESQEESEDSGREADLRPNSSSDPDGWQQYRKWISKAPVPRQRRGSIDPTLYTWKGYRSWTEQIKRNWPEK